MSRIGDMSSYWNWEWSIMIYMHFHLVFWKYVGLKTFHDKLHYWSLKFFIGHEISQIEPPPLHPSLSSHSFKIIFITSWRFDFLHKLLSCGFTFILPENTSHKTFTLFKKKKAYLLRNKDILHPLLNIYLLVTTCRDNITWEIPHNIYFDQTSCNKWDYTNE